MITDNFDNYVIMASNPFFSGRIPQPLSDAIEAQRKQTGESKTDVLIKALAQYVDYQLEENIPTIPPTQKMLREILDRLEKLENKQYSKKLQPKINQPKLFDDNKVITTDNEAQVLSTDELKNLLNISNSSLKNLKMNQIIVRKIEEEVKNSGYKINYSHTEKETKSDFWKVIKIDN